MEGPAPSPWARCLPGDSKRALGLAFIVAVALIWVAASFVVQGIEERGAHPVVLTLVANSLFAVYVPVYFLNARLRRRRQQAREKAHQAEARALVAAHHPRSDAPADAPPPLAPQDGRDGGGAPAAAPPMPLKQLFRAALVVAPLWYLAQLTFNLSLANTSVTSNTILSSTSSLFTFLFAVALLAEAFTLWKLGFIALLIAGTAMVTAADARYSEDAGAARQSVAGDLLCLLSAVVYGAYTVSIRKLLREDDETPMTMFFGFMGLLILAAVGPLVLVLWLAGVGLGRLSWRLLGMMVAKGLLDNVLSDYLWARAILLLGPTIATSGLALQVPIAVLLDALLRDPAWLHHVGGTVLTLLGGAVVLGGFFGINAAGEDDEKTRHAAWEERQQALQQELDFDLEEPEEGGDEERRRLAHDSPPSRQHMLAMEQVLRRELHFEADDAGGGQGWQHQGAGKGLVAAAAGSGSPAASHSGGSPANGRMRHARQDSVGRDEAGKQD